MATRHWRQVLADLGTGSGSGSPDLADPDTQQLGTPTQGPRTYRRQGERSRARERRDGERRRVAVTSFLGGRLLLLRRGAWGTLGGGFRRGGVGGARGFHPSCCGAGRWGAEVEAVGGGGGCRKL
uniref:Uncharacterized protein n=1 Tax=Zea mays TaxID=4577 RepID=A0A804NW73_MAIZE